MYTNYYAPYQMPVNYYNPSIPNSLNPNSANPNATINAPQVQTAQATAPIPQVSNDMIWVLNETEAISYPVAPNNSVILWDKNNDTVYIKSVNMQGVPSIRILDYKERIADNASKTAYNAVADNGSKFVCVDDFNALQAKFDGLQNELNELKAKSKPKTAKKEVSDDE